MKRQYPENASNWRGMPVEITRDELLVGGWQVMQSWEEPLMDAMAREVTAAGGDILEVGFGMGISARKILEYGCQSYTVIEAHPIIASIARGWLAQQCTQGNVIESAWQDALPHLVEQYDGILFDTYPFSRRERHRNHVPFVPLAPALLRDGGVLVYYSDETTQ